MFKYAVYTEYPDVPDSKCTLYYETLAKLQEKIPPAYRLIVADPNFFSVEVVTLYPYKMRITIIV